MSQEKIRIGIIGANAQYGWSMRAHLQALWSCPSAFGGPHAFVQAIETALYKLAGLVAKPEHIRQLLFG